MAKDAEAPDSPAIGAQEIEDYIRDFRVDIALTEAEIKDFAAGLAERLSNS